MDDSFIACPSIISQLFTLHELFKDKFSLVYYLTKVQESYTNLLEEVQCLCPELQADTIMTDFELVTLNSAETVYPRAARSGCLFDLGQCLREHLQFGYKVRYNEDAAFQHKI